MDKVDVFRGTLYFDDWEVYIDRLIVREDSMSIEGTGKGEFGTLRFTGDGQDTYAKAFLGLEVTYEMFSDVTQIDIALISLEKYKIKKKSMKIKGYWEEDGESYEFKAKLKRW